MKYYLIRNSDGDVYVTEYTKQELLKELDDEDWTDEFLESLPERDTNYWGGKVLLIKGEIVTPRKKEVVTKHDLP